MAATMNKHGGAGRGQGRKPLPVHEKRVKHVLFLRPDNSEWLADRARGEGVKPGAVVDGLISDKRNKS